MTRRVVRHAAFPAAGRLACAVFWLLLAAPAAAQPLAGPPRTAPADPCASGKEKYHQGDFIGARKDLEECLARSGDQVEILLPLTVMAIRENRLEDGVDLGSRAVKADPQDPEARYWYGRALLRSGRVEDARAQWEQGMAINANHKGILEGLARLAIQGNQPAKAYNLLNQIRQQGIDEPWLHRLLGDLAAGKGMWDQALEHLRAVMAKEGSNARDLMSASQLSIMAGKNDQAVDFSRRAVALEPGEATWGGLGEAFFAAQQIDSALVYLRMAVKNDDPDPRFVFNLANALEVGGLPYEAEERFKQFLALSPDDAMGHLNYGIHLGKQGRTGEGIAEVEKAVSLDSSLLNARIVLAQMKESAGDYAGARREVVLLKGQDPENNASLDAWLARLDAEEAAATDASSEGKVHLLHMVLPTLADAQHMAGLLEQGRDFGSLAVQYSSGPAAARGGDIGWIDPADMKGPLREAIERLGLDETSPPVESGGLYHLFKRVR